jgi:hypothetical protein
MQLTVWINAFIPEVVLGYTRRLTCGRHAGKTAVPLPRPARAHPFNLIKNLDAGYLTDQRTFSDSVTASCRMQSLVEFAVGSRVTISRQQHTSSGTTEVDLDTGAHLGYGVADMGGCSFSPLKVRESPRGVRRGQNEYRVPFGGSATVNYPTSAPPPDPTYETYLVGLAGDPLVWAAADIDYVGMFGVTVDPRNPRRCNVEFTGSIDEFPAFECYARYNGVTKTLFTSNPPKGNTVVDLLGGANRPVTGIAAFG